MFGVIQCFGWGILGDVRDRDALCPAMRGVHYVFHAAALK